MLPIQSREVQSPLSGFSKLAERDNGLEELAMKIAIIGAGNVGSALAASALKAGHTLSISASKADSAEQTAARIGAQAARTNKDAVEGAEMVILAVPGDALDSVVRELGRALEGKIVVDVTNQMSPDALCESAAERVQKQAPGARVVKAFNTAFASHHADPQVDGTNVDAFVAGDDAEAKKAVLRLAEQIGFRPVDAGGIKMARALEGMALLNIQLNMRGEDWSWQSGWKLLGPTGPTV
jgi:predicted dinucleotide-binding enzyme